MLPISQSYKSSMMMNRIILSIFPLLISITNALPSNSYYLIDIDNNVSSNKSYCSSILTNEQTYRIPNQCQHHLLCNPYYCDDQSFRCVKIRETLCCLYKYLQSICPDDHSSRMKDLFRSVYFQMSIEHGYCEINLERIEKVDQAYCIASVEEPIPTTTTITPSTFRVSYKQFYRRSSTHQPDRYRYRLAARQNYSLLANLDYLQQVTIIEENISSKSSSILRDYLLTIIFFLSILS